MARTFAGEHGDPAGHLDLLLFGTAASVVFALVAQIGEQVDFLRFLPRDRRTSRTSWWIALLSAGPGLDRAPARSSCWPDRSWPSLRCSHGVSAEHAAEPAHMYLEAFRYVLSQPDLALALTGTFVILSQVKINVTNAYAGSIAWSNFFSRLTHSHPGRVVWLVFNVLVALLLMEIGVYKALEQTLALYSNVAIAWVGALVADLVINKPLGLRPRQIEFKRAHLYDINPVGVGAMTIATIVSISAFYGLFGPMAEGARRRSSRCWSRFVTAPLIAWATDGKYYIARKPQAELAEPRRRSSAVSASTRSSPRTWRPAPPMPGRSARCAVRSTRAATISASRMRGSRRRSPSRSARCCRSRSTRGSTRSSATISACSRFPPAWSG